ncbi:hypothetical protein C0J52_06230 [Blattella germanica]|nr:hypothetical protein C0J52_06230 [Blattella germanica]
MIRKLEPAVSGRHRHLAKRERSTLPAKSPLLKTGGGRRRQNKVKGKNTTGKSQQLKDGPEDIKEKLDHIMDFLYNKLGNIIEEKIKENLKTNIMTDARTTEKEEDKESAETGRNSTQQAEQHAYEETSTQEHTSVEYVNKQEE